MTLVAEDRYWHTSLQRSQHPHCGRMALQGRSLRNINWGHGRASEGVDQPSASSRVSSAVSTAPAALFPGVVAWWVSTQLMAAYGTGATRAQSYRNLESRSHPFSVSSPFILLSSVLSSLDKISLHSIGSLELRSFCLSPTTPAFLEWPHCVDSDTLGL